MKVLRHLGIAAVMLLALSSCAVAQPTAPPPASSGPCSWVDRVKPEYELGERTTFVLAESYGDSAVQIASCLRVEGGYTQAWTARGLAGKSGFAKPGPVYVNSLLTPTGSFTVTEAFGRENPGTDLPYQQVAKNSYWGGRAGATFNNYFEGEGAFPDESLFKYMQAGDYEQAAVINYNRLPDAQPIHGRTFAIFLHAGMRATWGCISTDLEVVERFLQESQPGDRIVMGVESEIFEPATTG
ncbi:hypothetical protein [Glutamicibacter sp. NPDC087344]|uniref:hypothetical protein n=1 Tax=Glutamicibacter sp. NPDC087344 TaxID=3363994 RepID=UPI0038035B57